MLVPRVPRVILAGKLYGYSIERSQEIENFGVFIFGGKMKILPIITNAESIYKAVGVELRNSRIRGIVPRKYLRIFCIDDLTMFHIPNRNRMNCACNYKRFI